VKSPQGMAMSKHRAWVSLFWIMPSHSSDEWEFQNGLYRLSLCL
jgi:hypothetical protein